MNAPRKLEAVCIVTCILLSSALACLESTTAQQIHPDYAGTQNSDPPSIRFNIDNNSTLYSDSSSRTLELTVSMSSPNWMNLGTFLTSVKYKASWQNSPVQLFSWSLHDPAILEDDDSNRQIKVTRQFDLSGLPVGTYQITVNAAGGTYPTDFTSYTLATGESSYTFTFNIADRAQTTPPPTAEPQKNVLWSTSLTWDLSRTPAKNLWSSEIESKSRSWAAASAAGGTIYVGANCEVRGPGNGRFMGHQTTWVEIYSFNQSSGSENWRYLCNFEKLDGMVVNDGKVFFAGQSDEWSTGNSASSLCALDASSGGLLWSEPCELFFTNPVVDDKFVFVNSGHNHITAFNQNDGEEEWTYITSTDVVLASLTVADGVLYASSSNDHTIYALNTSDGSKLWSLTTEKGYSGGAVAYDGVVYVGSDDGNVYALNGTSGAELWRHDTTTPSYSGVNSTSHNTPIYSNGVIYISSHSWQQIYIPGNNSADYNYLDDRYSILALDATSGKQLWRTPDWSDTYGSPLTMMNDALYTINNQNIIALTIQNGATAWNYTVSNLWLQTNIAASDGKLYVGLSDEQIYALQPTLTEQNGSLPEGGDQQADWLIPVAAMAVLILVAAVLMFYTYSKRPQTSRQTDAAGTM